MRVALTGATGFIGSRVLQVMRQRGHDVTALVRDEAHVSALEAKGSIPVIFDLTDQAAVTNVLDKVDAATASYVGTPEAVCPHEWPLGLRRQPGIAWSLATVAVVAPRAVRRYRNG